MPDVPARIDEFLRENSQKMKELYGEEFADQSRWGPDTAAHLILAYIDRDPDDKLWYRNLSKLRKATDDRSRKLIVFTCHTGLLAHVGRPVLVANKLRELGHQVVFVADTDTKPDSEGEPTRRKYVEVIEKAGFEIYHMPLLVGEDTLLENCQAQNPTLKLYSVRMIEEETRNMVSVLSRIIREKERPAIMVTDFALVSNIPAEIMNIPVASFLNFVTSGYNKNVMSLPDRHPVREFIYRRGGDKWLESFSRSRFSTLVTKTLLLSMGIPHCLARMKLMIKEKRFLRIKSHINSQLTGDICLFPDFSAHKGMVINHRALPVGPIVWEPEIPDLDEKLVKNFKEFVENVKGRPLVYVTMGSTGKVELFRLIMEVFKNKYCSVAMTTGGQFDISELGNLPHNCCVVPFYPGSEICKAASLMINHGGSGSMNQAILSGVPQISLPTHGEQQWGSELVAGQGLGKQILLSKLTVGSLDAAVEELLNDCGNRRGEGQTLRSNC